MHLLRRSEKIVCGDGKEGVNMEQSVRSSYIKRKRNHVKTSKADKIYYGIVYTLLVILLIVVLYPVIYIISASFSSPTAVSTGKVILFPVDFSVMGYKKVFEYKEVFTGYKNTVFYTVAGTAINVALTMAAAYPLARKELLGNKFFTFLFTFTMLFSGGMIPKYLVIKQLGMLNSVWAMLIPNAISVTNLIIARTFIKGIPNDLLEAAKLDGCSDFNYFFKIVMPLSKAVLAVLVLYYAVGHWNAYFNAFLYLTDKKLFPLQLFLREILIMNQVAASTVADPETAVAIQGLSDLLKYSLIVVATAPILCIYPFVQKYFVKGVMIGSLKG